ncbi:serine/threonine-protein kinase [Rubrivirga marina]|uniref:serine/threonine-protein kinase n=1 Tax=Rubrivirga marina TaxID=1196024 RepID=UPI00117A0824|nr:serine/threonine-protein kinase [Rubrivirga marina]
MPTDSRLHRRAADLFADALDRDPAEREALLADASLDPDVIAEVRSLLAAHDDAGDDALAPLAFGPPGPEALVGQTVGPWRLEGVLGTGGMGVVYEARRVAGGFEQRAALKRVRPGVGADFHARFLRERELLAGLDHAGVARLLDGGIDGSGAPYLAMEFAEGEPITTYADRHGLRLRDRIALFLQACEAVAHAHRHLVVHRDLKPAHVLVADGERGRARVKLLDFGIAKLLKDDDDPGLTRTGAGPLTPQYAAPEQVLGRPVTTATDVYALGVVLYELLTGSRPYDVGGLPLSEAARVVAETQPVRPSQAASRTTDPRRLRGDLDTVVLKALAKEPERRYASAETFADDLRRYLGGLPVEAQPDSVRYRAGKFVRRHRTAVASATLVVLALVGGLGAALWQAAEARAERRTAHRVNAFVTEMLASADPYGGVGRGVTVVEVADIAAERAAHDLAGEPATEAGVRLALGETYRGTGEYEKAEAQVRRALALRQAAYGPRHPETGEALNALGALLIERSRFEAADRVLALALDVHRRHPGEHGAAYARTLVHLGQVALETGDLDAAERHLREAIAMIHRHPRPVPPALLRAGLNARYTLGVTLHEAGEYAVSDSVLVPLLTEMRRADRPPPYLGTTLTTLAWNREYLGETDRIEPYLRESLDFREDRFGPRHTETGYALNDLAYYYHFYGTEYGAAEDAYRQALEIFRDAHGENYTAVPAVLNNLASLYRGTGREREAIPLLEEAVAIQRQLLGPDHVDVSFPLINLGRTYVTLGEPERAEAPLREALALRRRAHGDDHTRVGTALDALAAAARGRGRIDEAITLYRQAADTHARALGPDNANVAEMELFLAEALLEREAAGDRDEARRLVGHARPIISATYPDGNDRTAKAEVLAARLGLRPR